MEFVASKYLKTKILPKKDFLPISLVDFVMRTTTLNLVLVRILVGIIFGAFGAVGSVGGVRAVGAFGVCGNSLNRLHDSLDFSSYSCTGIQLSFHRSRAPVRSRCQSWHGQLHYNRAWLLIEFFRFESINLPGYVKQFNSFIHCEKSRHRFMQSCRFFYIH